MIKQEKSIVIDAPVEQVFAYFMDPANAMETETGADEVKDVQQLPNGGHRYTEVYKFLGLRTEMTSEDIEVVPNERVISTFESSLLDGTSTQRFERLEGSKTRVSCVGEATFPGGPLAKLGEPFLEKYFSHSMEMSLEAAKAHIEANALATTPS